MNNEEYIIGEIVLRLWRNEENQSVGFTPGLLKKAYKGRYDNRQLYDIELLEDFTEFNFKRGHIITSADPAICRPKSITFVPHTFASCPVSGILRRKGETRWTPFYADVRGPTPLDLPADWTYESAAHFLEHSYDGHIWFPFGRMVIER